MRDLIALLAHKGIRYWAVMLLNVTVGLYIGHRISESPLWMRWRYMTSHAIQSLNSRSPMVNHTAVVTIDTDEYWTPSLSARVPINRAYLAQLIAAIDRGNPYLVALDFDLRSPDPDGALVEFPSIESESRALIAQIRQTAANRHVVLPRTIWNGEHESYRLDSDIWNLDPDLLQVPNVHSGYIAMPPDLRQTPLAVPLDNASPLDSFSLAIARARNEHVTDLLMTTDEREHLPFASYIPEKQFDAQEVHRTARTVLTADSATLQRWFAGKLVLIGAAWEALPAGRGDRVDSYETPAGMMPGVFVHANFVEAFLDQRTFEPAPEWIVAGLETALLIVCMLVLAAEVGTRKKIFTWTSVVGVLIVANYIALQNLGRFFDFFVPLVMIVGHVAIEQINDWRKEARMHRLGQATRAVAMIVGTSAVLLAGTPSEVKAAPAHEAASEATADGARVPAPSAPPDREIDPMGQPIIKHGVKSVEPKCPGGTRRDGTCEEVPPPPVP